MKKASWFWLILIIVIIISAIVFVFENNKAKEFLCREVLHYENDEVGLDSKNKIIETEKEEENNLGKNLPAENQLADLIFVEKPLAGEKITSPLKFSGQARGYWFFEASFPVVLVNWDGLIIAEGTATALGDWMTEDLVPFQGELKFIKPNYGERGALILQRDNPSGLSQFDQALEIPILFAD